MDDDEEQRVDDADERQRARAEGEQQLDGATAGDGEAGVQLGKQDAESNGHAGRSRFFYDQRRARKKENPDSANEQRASEKCTRRRRLGISTQHM